MSSTIPSICIPRVLGNIKYYDVKNVFEKLFGKNSVEKVDIIRKENDKGECFNKVFVHFKKNNINNCITNDNNYIDNKIEFIKDKLINGGNIKIVYDEHLYWKCFALKNNNNNAIKNHNNAIKV